MPLINNNVFCINHTETKMIRNIGFNAIITVERTEIATNFDPKSGVPVVAYSCPICGYVEMYAAQKTEYWDSAIRPEDDYRAHNYHSILEQEIVTAIQAPNSPFQPLEVKREVQVLLGSRNFRIDVVVISKLVTYIIEIKSKLSLSDLERAAAKIKDITNIYRHQRRSIPLSKYDTGFYIPVVITENHDKIGNNIRGVPIVKYDLFSKKFVNFSEIPELLINNNLYDDEASS